ncbi:alpha/beta hydrolase [Mesorhizobium sp. UC74_2]|uniref:alpha/beta hydrolase n=1 Tax=Mesorhizobium sp. UC74_2 TaxID=3350171 RepID=UPI00367068BE
MATIFFVGSALAARGFTTAIPDYRVFPEVCFPGFLEDGAEAMRWTVDHIAEFGGDPHRVIAMGHSAGAHIAAMLAFDRKWLLGLGLDASVDLSAMIGLAGPYDFLPLHSRTLKQIFGPENCLGDTQPINFVDAFAPPAFLATGKNDRTVEPGNTIRLTERIRCVGGEAETKLYDRVNHRTLIGAFAGPLRFLAPVLDDVADFALKHTHQQSLHGLPTAQGRSA